LDTEEWKSIENKWQENWTEQKSHEANPSPGAKKFFVNFPIPYVNGLLHFGHAYSASRIDVLARYKRFCGYNVLFAQGWH
jgi:leucyl-tRNA synthetase